MLNLRSVDLNLLPVFEAAYEERSLSRAAERLAMTQSAVSHALGRLRALFRDELFVRQARGVLPTQVAHRIYGKVHPALVAARQAVTDTREFVPGISDRRFFVAIAHPLGPMIAVRLRARLAKAAPGIRVDFSTRSRPIELERGLRESRIDAAIDWLSPKGGQFRDVALFDEGLVAVARRGHPALRARTWRKILESYEFVILRPRLEGEAPIAGLDDWRRLKPNISLEVSEIIEVFMVASQSDLCGLIPRSMADAARRLLDLRPLPATPRVPDIPIKLIWHSSRDHDEGHAFLLRELAAATKQAV
jgi:DNA-binding transcriptional LysR family regulator